MILKNLISGEDFVMKKLTIQEVETLLFLSETKISSKTLKLIEADNRKGVQAAITRWKKQQEKLAALNEKYEMLQCYERNLRKQGTHLIAGVDEVGRGPLAGPVIAAAVILPNDVKLVGIDDSKKLNEAKREFYYNEILAQAISVGIGCVSAKEIDEINIYQASIKAMQNAIMQLDCRPEHLLVDALTLPMDINQTNIIKGDAKSVSIAAASIIAKVTRDRIMKELDDKYPQYGFVTNMGYGTSEHMEALQSYGPIEEHRFSFQPVQASIFEKSLG
jgi:ribonuclease HII